MSPHVHSPLRRRPVLVIGSVSLATSLSVLGSAASAPARAAEATAIPNSGYTLVGFDSESDPYPAPPSLDGTAAGAFDGDYSTQWGSSWAGGEPAPMPHYLAFDIGAEHTLTALGYSVKVQNNGTAADVVVYTTNDAAVAASGSTAGWTKAGAARLHQPTSNTEIQQIPFDAAVTARYVRLEVTSAINGSANASASELVVYTTDAITPATPGPTSEPTTDPTSPAATGYKVTVDGVHPEGWREADDTPASLVLDENGDFHLQQAHALYAKEDHCEWSFYEGTSIDDFKRDSLRSDQPDNVDTTDRCNESPTGVESTRTTSSSRSEANYCDLTNLWIDPDTGDWYGLVHNEFTPRPFGDGLHYDSIDYAVSHDHGVTWTIVGHVLTSPYSTQRADEEAFPEDTYYYGDGDPRLFVDYESGYFYAFYGSRIVDKGASWRAFYEHAARAPISGKMTAGTWQKWYDGAWTEPGIGGKESNIVPVDDENPSGYTAPEKEYKPTTPGRTSEQVARGDTPPTSPLFVMDVAYDAYLGLYIAEPQAIDQSGKAPQEIYATRDLATQQWFKLGDTGTYTNASWYRWFVDPANGTSTSIVGRSMRSYCSFGCQGGSYAEYIDLTIDSDGKTGLAAPVTTDALVTITTQDGLLLTRAADDSLRGSTTLTSGSSWTFHAVGDGSYTITAPDGRGLGITSDDTANRAWDTPLALLKADGTDVGQQWWVMPAGADRGGAAQVRLVNRYSGLALGVGESAVASTPQRSWDGPAREGADDAPGSALGRVAQQVMSVAAFVEPTTEPTHGAGSTSGAATSNPVSGTARAASVAASSPAPSVTDSLARTGAATGVALLAVGLIAGGAVALRRARSARS